MSTLETGNIVAVVPVKLLAHSKRRLTPLLSRDERVGLSCAMLADVLTALTQAASLDGVLVVTGDGRAAAIARSAGAHVLADSENSGTTAAVNEAAHYLIGKGVEGMLVIPADVPLIASADVEAIVAAHRGGSGITLVAARADGGTNALVCSPPDAIPFRFGHDSFRLHCEAARARSITPRVLEVLGLEQDLDRPDDVAAFLEVPSQTRTCHYLTTHGVARRCAVEPASS
jgi:2-phospho-L-lactate guanylyltransferase